MTGHSPRAWTTVLVVEDDFLVRTCAAEALGEHGFEVLQAADGPAALQVLEASGPVDVLFTDINMPGAFDGLGLAAQVQERWPHVAIIITSGRTPPPLGRGLAGFVAKPYLPDCLAGTITRLIARSGAHRLAS